MVVEDDPGLRAVIRFNLQRAGFDIVAASSGTDGWSKLGHHPIEMVVTDMQMPGMTGIELCQKMRADHRFSRLPLMLLTAKGLELNAGALRLELGVCEVMFKPFSPKQLCRAVARHLAESHILLPGAPEVGMSFVLTGGSAWRGSLDDPGFCA